MTNVLGNYVPILYANKALEALMKRLGLAARVNRGYDAERRNVGKGKVISIKKPSVFTAQSAPGSAVDLSVGTVDITLSTFKEVRFALPDNEQAWTGSDIITDHIMPAGYAIADAIDLDLAALIPTVAHAYVEPSAATAATMAGILAVQKAQFDLKVPIDDEAAMHFMIGGKEQADLLALSAFAQWQGAGQVGLDTQLRGFLGRRYGYEFFANQNRGTQAYADITDFLGAGPTAAAGATSIAVTALGTTEAYKKGSILKFTSGAESGNQYAVTADVTMSGGGGTFVINPGLRVGCTSGDTFAINDLAALNQGAAGTGALDNVTDNLNLAFHRDWAAVGFAALPDETIRDLGVRVFTVQDPVTGISLRARIFYDGANSKTVCVVDALWGVREIDADRACRYEIKNS